MCVRLPFPACELFRSFDVDFRHLLVLLRNAVGVLDLYESFHPALLLRLSVKKNELK